MHVFCIFVLAAVQHNYPCFTCKGALEICSLLLLLSLYGLLKNPLNSLDLSKLKQVTAKMSYGLFLDK